MGAPIQTLQQWKPLYLEATKLPWPRRRDAVQLELNVERSPRYKPGNVTWCNVYATDFIRGMGVPAPRHWMTKGGDPATPGQGMEMSANRLHDWFETCGARYGWVIASSEVAQRAASRGHLVVVLWKNPTGASGHIAVVLGPDRISQAGRKNLFVGTLKEGFGASKPLSWYVQMDRPGGHHG